MEFILIPTKKCGDIDFYADRKLVRSLLGKYETFTKSKTSVNSCDDFGFCHSYYDKSNRLIALEFFPESVLVLDDISLFVQTPNDLINLLKLKDSNLYVDEYSILSKILGIGIDLTENHINSILVCTHDYY